jgi:hypothetical protein
MKENAEVRMKNPGAEGGGMVAVRKGLCVLCVSVQRLPVAPAPASQAKSGQKSKHLGGIKPKSNRIKPKIWLRHLPRVAAWQMALAIASRLSPLYFRRFVAHLRQMIRGSFHVWLSAVLLAAMLGLCPQMARGALAKAVVLENNVGYLRVARADQSLLADIPAALNSLQATNSLAGLVLDLRFADGSNFTGLDAVESQLEQSKLPLAILINGQTAGSAARLAEDLREANTGLVIGSAEGSFVPDIAVTVSTNAEWIFLKNPYNATAQDGTNFDASTNLLPFVAIDHTTEADLVREKIKDGDEDDSTAAATPEKPFIRDPVLARGVDFIKGLAALHLGKTS